MQNRLVQVGKRQREIEKLRALKREIHQWVSCKRLWHCNRKTQIFTMCVSARCEGVFCGFKMSMIPQVGFNVEMNSALVCA